MKYHDDRLVMIIWYDAHTKDEWCSEEPDYESFAVSSVGWMTEKENGYVLSPSRAANTEEHPHYRFGDLHIPKGCVERIVDICLD